MTRRADMMSTADRTSPAPWGPSAVKGAHGAGVVDGGGRGGRASRTLRTAVLAACALAYALSVGSVVLGHPNGLTVSADPSAPTLPLWQVFLPPVVGVALTLLLPPRRTSQPAVVGEARAFRHGTAFLAGLAVLTIGLGLSPLSDVDFVLSKALLFMVLPALALRFVWRGGVEVLRAGGAWRWWAPLAVVVVWAWLSQAAPRVPAADFSGHDLTFLLLGAAVTALTAGVGEELFYRRWLQTRLEVWLGPAAGIALTCVLFGLMHFGTHGSTDLARDAALIVAVQGTSGLFLGLLWWRYRNIAMNILAHLIMNGWAVAAYLLTR